MKAITKVYGWLGFGEDVGEIDLDGDVFSFYGWRNGEWIEMEEQPIGVDACELVTLIRSLAKPILSIGAEQCGEEANVYVERQGTKPGCGRGLLSPKAVSAYFKL